MHITSTINPLTTSSDDIPVLLLSYQNTRRFIARPKRYADLVRIASNKLALDPDAVIMFQTSTLDICRGHSVELDESAYQVMCTALDELTVVVHGDVVQRESELGTRELQRGKTLQGLQTPPFTREEDQIGRATSLVEEEEEEEAGTSASIYTGQGPSPSEKSKQDLEKSAAATQEEEVEEVEVEEVEKVEVEEVKEVEENAPGPGRHANIQRGEPEIEIISHPSPGKKTINQTPTANKRSRKSISVTVSGKLPTPGPSNSGNEFSSSRVRPDPEARYTVIISGPPDQEAEFKTRGKHLVKKVLAGACKTFGLDLARAHLIVAKPVNGDVQYFECPPELTMAKCGVETGKKYHIHIDDEEVDELPEES